MKLWKKVLIGLGMGILAGAVLKENAIYVKPLGDLFIRLIKMIIVPLIFLAIVSGITSPKDPGALKRMGVKAVFAYTLTTFFAVVIGIGVGKIFQPGVGVSLNFSCPSDASISVNPQALKLVDILLNIVPENIFGAMAQGNILQVVFFAIFTGVTLNVIENKTSMKIIDMFQLLSQMVFRMVYFIIQLAPLAAFALTAWVVGTQGMSVLKCLMNLVACAYLAFGIQYLIFGCIIYVWTRLSPVPFFKKSIEYQSLAFATSSSKAALPTTMQVCREKLGISKMSSSFVLPLGASINMDGIAIYMGLCALFFAQATGKVFTAVDYGLIIFTSTIGSMGGAGIPSGTIVMLPMVLGVVGLPIEGIALLAGIDRIVDMMRTTISITGDAAITLCLDHSEGLLDKKTYNS